MALTDRSIQDALPTIPTVVDEFRQAMRRLASTVCVVTAQGADGPLGMTMTSVTSVSMDPPTLLICVNRSSRISAALQNGTKFCVNVLRATQQAEAAAFGGGARPEERFSIGAWQFDEGRPPRLAEAQAGIMCSVEGSAGVGTHQLVIGRVLEVHLKGDVAPLLYSDGRYAAINPGAVGF